jgi:hypothetical protein
MDIPPEMRKCVVFVGWRNNVGPYYLAGTAFFAGKGIEGTDKGFVYLITAKHVIDNIRDKGCDKVYLRVNLRNQSATWVETDIQSWKFHPDDLALDVVDVAVMIVNLSSAFDHRLLPLTTFANDAFVQANIKVGLEIFLVGLFSNHSGKRKNIPIVRFGNIVAMPEEQIETEIGLMDAYLVEVRSLGGISGSPVFVRFPGVTTHNTEEGPAVGLSEVYSLLGLMHGHWSISRHAEGDTVADIRGEREVNMGIAIVVPASKILEVIQQPAIRDREKKAEAELRKFIEEQSSTKD